MRFCLALAITATVALSGAGRALAAELPKWGPRADIEGGLDTSGGRGGVVDLFVPFAQSNTTLLFGNARAGFDDTDNGTGSFGLVLRHMLASGWNLGAYGYYDRARSDFAQGFNQATLGVEALSRDIDLRANVYLPFGDRVKTIGSVSGGPSIASLVGTSIQITTPGALTFEERAMRGFDAEVGWRLPIWDDDSKALRLYAGVFHFDDDIVEAVTGPRLRAELTVYEIPGLWEDSRLTVGAGYMQDDVRGGNGFGLLRLSVPLQPPAEGAKLTAQERRMMERVVRDVDIVTGTRTTQGPTLVETATQTANGTGITVIDSATTSGADLQTAVTNAGADSLVILSGDFNTTTTTTLQTGQTMMGTGNVTVRGASGHTAVLTTPGATINASTSVTGIGAVTMANDSTLTGMTINQTMSLPAGDPRGVVAIGLSNVTIINNTITVDASNASAFGTYIADSSNVIVAGNTISATRPGATAMGLYARNSSLIIADNTLNAGGSTTYATYLVATGGETLTILPGSTGNVFGGNCAYAIGGGTITGSVSYTTTGGASGTCP